MEANYVIYPEIAGKILNPKYTFCCSLTAKGYSFKRKNFVIRANRHTITRTEFQECDGTLINEFGIEFDNREDVCAGSLAFSNFH